MNREVNSTSHAATPVRALLAIALLILTALACSSTGATPTPVVKPRPTPRTVPTFLAPEPTPPPTPTPTPTLPPDGVRLGQGPVAVISRQADRAGAEAVLRVMSEMVYRLTAEIGLHEQEVEVRLFASRDEYNAALGVTALPEQVGNVVDSHHIWLLSPVNQSEGDRADILKGAQVQMARVTLLQVPSMPLWLRDGITSYEARLWDKRRTEQMRSLVAMRRITGLPTLDSSTYEYMGGAVTAHTVVDYFVRTYGLQSLSKLVAGLREASLDQAFQQAVGISLSDFSRSWHDYVMSAYGE